MRSVSTTFARGPQRSCVLRLVQRPSTSLASTVSLVSSNASLSTVCWYSRRAYASVSDPPDPRSVTPDKHEEDVMDMLLSQGLADVEVRSSPAPPHPRPSTGHAGATHSPAVSQMVNDADRKQKENAQQDKGAEVEDDDLRVVELHNLPRNWMHEEIIEFLHQIAAHAGIEPPASPEEQVNGAEEDASGRQSAIPHVRSPFVQHLRIPFGRRTGLVYGSPRIVLRSRALAHYLVHDLVFDDDDYRNRIHFTDVTPSPRTHRDGGEDDGTDREDADSAADKPTGHRRSRDTHLVDPQYVSIEETIEQEQAAALATLELDRYLLAPDLLLDITKMHQRRLVTRGEKVVLRAFTDMASADASGEAEHDEQNSDVNGSPSAIEAELFEAEEGSSVSSAGTRRAARRRRRALHGDDASRPAPRAGTMNDLGHGSMHNMPIPKPYVMGRKL